MRSLPLLVVLLSLLPELATAQIRASWSDAAFQCGEFAPCEDDTHCQAPDPHCATLSGDSHVCSPRPDTDYELLCCMSDEDCGKREGLEGACVWFSNDPLAHEFAGICVFPGGFDLCLGDALELSVDTVTPCLDLSRDDDAPIASRYAAGDCDGDGVKNDVDPCPCDPKNECAEPVDGGVRPIDGGTRPGLSGAGGCSASPTPNEPSALALLAALLLAAHMRRRARAG